MAILPHKSARIKKIYLGSKSVLISSDGCISYKNKWKKPDKIDKRSGFIKTYLPFDKDGISNRNSYSHDMHSLISRAFNGDKKFDMVVHIDGDKTNNDPSNLKGIYKNKRVYKYKIGGEYTNEFFESVTSAGNSIVKKGKRKSGIASVSSCCNSKKPSWAGFEWSFLPPEEYKSKRFEIITDAIDYSNKSKVYYNKFEFFNKYSEIEPFHMNNTIDQLFDIVLDRSQPIIYEINDCI